MMNNYTKVAALLFIMWAAPHCSQKAPPVKTVDAGIALAVQEDILKFAIQRRLYELENTTMQAETPPVTFSFDNGDATINATLSPNLSRKIQAVSASEAVNQ